MLDKSTQILEASDGGVGSKRKLEEEQDGDKPLCFKPGKNPTIRRL